MTVTKGPPQHLDVGNLVDQRCGTCRLWGVNFYPRRDGWPANNTCCADVVMDLPASFIPNRQTMQANEGEGCICWQPNTEEAQP